jgi:hypothetical protein
LGPNPSVVVGETEFPFSACDYFTALFNHFIESRPVKMQAFLNLNIIEQTSLTREDIIEAKQRSN